MPDEATVRSGSRLNLDYLHELSGNDPVIMCEVIDVFMEHAPALVRELGTLCEARDETGVRRAAHKLKPMLAYVGMTGLHGRAVQVEAADIAAMGWDQLEELVRPILAEFDAARDMLADFRATLAAPRES